MSVKRAVSFLLAVFLVLPLGICSVEESAYAGSEAVSVQKEGIGGYYYEQLPDEARDLYEAMYNMYDQGIFKTGT